MKQIPPSEPPANLPPSPDKTMDADELRVLGAVEKLKIGFDLRQHAELRRRLVEIGPHFNDSVQMAWLIRAIYGKLRAALDLPDERPEHLMRTAVVHDIGKSGPPGPDTPFREAVRRLFAPPAKPFKPVDSGRTRTISEFVSQTGMAEPEKIMSALREAGVEPDKEPMLAFWRRHAKWSFDILSGEHGPDIDADLAQIAASHHIFEEQNPAHLEVGTDPKIRSDRAILDMVLVLTAIDKYQAFRGRGRLGHADAVARTAVSVTASPALNPDIMIRFSEILKTISASEAEINQALVKAES